MTLRSTETVLCSIAVFFVQPTAMLGWRPPHVRHLAGPHLHVGTGVQGEDFEQLKQAAMDEVAVSQRTFKYPITTGDQQVCMRAPCSPLHDQGILKGRLQWRQMIPGRPCAVSAPLMPCLQCCCIAATLMCVSWSWQRWGCKFGQLRRDASDVLRRHALQADAAVTAMYPSGMVCQ